MYVDPDNCRKAFHFDLDYHKLCEEFGPKNTSAAYHKIKAFMTSHGFEKAQYSGYVSVAPMKHRNVKTLKTHGRIQGFLSYKRCPTYNFHVQRAYHFN